MSQQTDHLKTVLARHEDALLRQDAGGIAENYCEDALLIANGEVHVSRSAIQAFYANLIKSLPLALWHTDRARSPPAESTTSRCRAMSRTSPRNPKGRQRRPPSSCCQLERRFLSWYPGFGGPHRLQGREMQQLTHINGAPVVDNTNTQTAKAFGVPAILTTVVAARGGLLFPQTSLFLHPSSSHGQV
jgi:hypothetical protein